MITENGLIKVDCKVVTDKKDAEYKYDEFDQRLCHGTGGYRVTLTNSDDDYPIDHCLSPEGDKFIVECVGDGWSVVLTIIEGDVERIKKLVKAEIDHYDCVTTFC